jgi:SnoaL-like domain
VPVEIDLGVRRLIARYSHLVDDGDYAAAVALFSQDGRFRMGDTDLHGRDALKAWLETLGTPMSHAVTNVVVSSASRPGEFHAVSDLALATLGDSAPQSWSLVALGRYHDTIAGHDEGQLHFTQRILTIR